VGELANFEKLDLRFFTIERGKLQK